MFTITNSFTYIAFLMLLAGGCWPLKNMQNGKYSTLSRRWFGFMS